MEKLKVGDRLGCYELLRKLGEGGMGMVFAAVHKEIERHVAIKVLRPEIAQDQQSLRRLFNEARAANRIDHPGAVQIHDCVCSEDGVTAYLVMEYLHGVTLGSRLAECGGALPETSVLRIGREIADLLSAAHEKGIIHRDLKPENVMLVPDPAAVDGERVKVLDFGIAKLSKLGTTQTVTNVIMGTPRYMSPEQWCGAAQVDEKSDVYSLGVMLFQLLSGVLPFNAASHGELQYQHRMVAAPELFSVAPGSTKGTADLVMSMLCKEKSERPAMTEVAAALAYAIRSMDGLSIPEPDVTPTRAASSTLILPTDEPSSSAPEQTPAWIRTATPSKTWRTKRWIPLVLAGTTITALGVSVRAGMGLTSGPLPALAPRHLAARTAPPAAREPKGPLVELLHNAPSTLRVSSASRYPTLSAKALVDGNLETAWNSRPGELVGASVTFTVPDYARVHTLQLTSGFAKVGKKGDLFTMNHRITEVTLFRNGARVGAFKLDPDSRALQEIPVNQHGGRFELAIDAVVPGTRPSWREVCISELMVWGWLPEEHPPARQEPSIESVDS